MGKNVTSAELLEAAIGEWKSGKPTVDRLKDVLEAKIADEESKSKNEITFTNRRQAMVKSAVLTELYETLFGAR